MKPAWDKLIKQFKDSKTLLVADVDCTADGEALCQEVGVSGYPTIKYGDPSDLEDYNGGRDFNELKEFAEKIGPPCNPANIDLCDAEKKKQIEEFMKMSPEKLEEMIKEKDEAMKTAESDFEKFVEGLQKSYEEAEKKKTQDIQDIKDSGLGLMKAVHSHAAKSKGEKGEL